MDILNDSFLVISFFKLSVVSVALFILIVTRKYELTQFRGWRYIQIGFVCIILGNLVDVSTYVPTVRRFLAEESLICRALVEQEISYVLGFLFLTRGFMLLMPALKLVKKTQSKYSTIIDDQTELIWCYSPDFILSFANDAFFRYFELEADSVIGTAFKLVMPAEDEKKFQTMMDGLTLLKPAGLVDHLIILPGGEQRWHRRKVKLLFDGEGKPLEYHIISQDITERKWTEYALQQEKMELGEQVQLGAVELKLLNTALRLEITEREKVQRELMKAVAVANAANEAKSGFLANMGHELRTPMHGILTYSRFGIDKGSEVSREKLLKYFRQINSSGHRLMRLLNDLLDLSKLQAGKMSYHFDRYDLKIISRRVISELRFLASNKNISVQVAEKPQKAMVRCDQGRIRQVVSNLIDNAIKYSDNGTQVNVTFEERVVESKAVTGPVLTMRVSDQGIGVPESEREAVFDMFIQSSKTRTGAGGTGLGLSICKEIVTAHNGRIYVEANEDGCGSVFIVDLLLDNKEVA